MVLTQVNYYEKLQFMLFIILMANYLSFSNTVPKQLEVFIRSSPVIFFVWVCTLCSERNTQCFSLTTEVTQEILITSRVSKGENLRTNWAYVDVPEVNQQYTKIFIIGIFFSTYLEEILLNHVIWKRFNVSIWKYCHIFTKTLNYIFRK